MRQLFACVLLVFPSIGAALRGDVAEQTVVTCSLRQFAFRAEVNGSDGGSCWGSVATLACMGACETFEIDVGEQLLTEESTCQVSEYGEKQLLLTECSDGQVPLLYSLKEAVGCECGRCDADISACMSGVKRRI